MSENWRKFRHNAFEHAERVEDCAPVRDDGDAYIIKGYYDDEQITEYHWAANAPEPVLRAIGDDICMLTFLPRAWVPAFEAEGFAIRSVYRDYWKNDLADVPADLPREPLTESDAQAASEVAMRCFGQSRGFTGASEALLREWIGGAPEGIRDSAVLGARDADGSLAGVVMTGLYGDESEKGPVAWIRMVAVRPDRQNRGIGRALVRQALSRGKRHGATRAFLAAEDENANGIHLYESLGFVPKNDDGEIAMWRR